MEERLGNMVTAPTATSSSWWIALLLAPQLSDPIHRKWPTWLALLVALRTPLQGHQCVNEKRGTGYVQSNTYYNETASSEDVNSIMSRTNLLFFYILLVYLPLESSIWIYQPLMFDCAFLYIDTSHGALVNETKALLLCCDLYFQLSSEACVCVCVTDILYAW